MTQPFAAALADDDEIGAWFTPHAELGAMLAFEAALAAAQAACGLIPARAAAAIETAVAGFVPDMDALAVGLRQDGVLGPSLVAALRQHVPEPHTKFLHFGATSQDITDTALTLRLKPVLALLDDRVAALIAALKDMRAAQGSVRLMAQTRMQQALPFTVADKLATWLQPLPRHRARLAALAPRLLVVQLGGPVGTRAELHGQGNAVATGLAQRLGLQEAPCWHNARDNIVELGNIAAMICGATGKIGADAGLLAQTALGALHIEAGGRSSAMTHKANPVTAELLVTLARYAGGLAGTLTTALVHENERSGAAWTLEWLTLPPLLCVAGAALAQATGLVRRLHFVRTAGL
jgi:3-carboxy-cis,cis-muconate cycloisomerase